jgi:hypothetical protein
VVKQMLNGQEMQMETWNAVKQISSQLKRSWTETLSAWET